MKKICYGLSILSFVSITCRANTTEIFLKGVDKATVTTGDFLTGTDHQGIITNVAETADLLITARSGGSNQVIKTLVASMGINSDLSGQDQIRLDAGEKLILSFNKKVEITRLDFNHFSSGEAITVAFQDQFNLSIENSDLSNGVSDYLNTNIVVHANKEIEFFTTGASVIGLDRIDLTVLEILESEGELLLSFSCSNGLTQVTAAFNDASTTNCFLQYKENLAETNGWNTISSFSSNTTWPIATTNQSGFYRAIVQ